MNAQSQALPELFMHRPTPTLSTGTDVF